MRTWVQVAILLLLTAALAGGVLTLVRQPSPGSIEILLPTPTPMSAPGEININIPAIGEVIPTPTPVSVPGKININTASVEELLPLYGIGPAKAQAIVEYREQNGPFSRVEDLLLVTGIGSTTLENIRDFITVR